MLLNHLKKKYSLTILDKYLLREFLNPFVLGVGGFAIIGIADILFYIIELSVLSGVNFFTTIKLLVYKLPAVMVLFFPMAALFSTMLLLVRMAKDNELSVLRTSGIQTFRIIFPILFLGVAISYVSYIFNENLVPISNQAADTLIKRELRKTPPPNIAENTIFNDANRFFYIKTIRNNTMENIMILESTFKSPRIIIAKKADWKDFRWTLYDGTLQEFDKEGHLKYTSSFDEMSISVQQNIKSYYKRQKTAKEMDSAELREKIQTLNDSGLDNSSYKVEFHLKKSLPTTCLVFVLVGVAYCLSFVKTGKDWWGVIFAICISVLTVGLYFVLIASFRAFAKAELIPAIVGAWTPNLIYSSIASYLIYYQCKYR